MTTQIGDIYEHQNKEYRIVALSSGSLFNPKEYGLEPHSCTTACWRGYYCEYAVIDDLLVLKTLYIYNRDGIYPELCGKEVSPPEVEECTGYSGSNKKLKKITIPAHFGHRVYKDVCMPLKYSGKVLLGHGFLKEYRRNMGFPQAWAYNELLELQFEEGILINRIDVSELARAKRKELSSEKVDVDPSDIEAVKRYVEDSFSLDYSSKVWWEKE